MLWFVTRIWSAVVGLLMIGLSLVLQFLMFLVLSLGLVGMFPKVEMGYFIWGLFLLFNGVSCFEYFRKRRVIAYRKPTDGMLGLVDPSSKELSMAMYLVPRGIDRIITGREFLG